MKICVAQTKPIKGDIQRNIEGHKKVIDLAASQGAGIIIFPELSLTGYEPTLAKDLATAPNDNRFDDFQKISDLRQIAIGVGVPIKSSDGIFISMILFQSGKTRQTYSKEYLHPDEEPFFVSGQNSTPIKVDGVNMAFAICYELSVPAHSENAVKQGAEIYVASVAKFANGIDSAIKTLSEIATKYSMMVLMSNCVGKSDGHDCAGKSSVWNSKGVLLGQLDDRSEGIIMIDTDTQESLVTTKASDRSLG
jgi:predicted amidohydrolase